MKKIRKRTALIVAILAVILIAAAIFAIGLSRTPEKALLKIMSDRVDLQVKNVHYTEVGSSGTTWEIQADTVRYQKKENLALFDQVKVKLAMKDGRVFTMSGDKGRFNTQTRDLEIEGNVGIVSDNGDRFTTDRLSYKDARKRIETDCPVTMENPSIRISAVGMIFSLEGNKVTLLSQVRANSSGK
ncbi:MAG: LPS export ABC transporter periplasmic protein LptC [Deltaproteobacteria bacterium]|nr:LPS export ABC transporter periplasmic protein LptC [Deltaproteobacteria bacterium]